MDQFSRAGGPFAVVEFVAMAELELRDQFTRAECDQFTRALTVEFSFRVQGLFRNSAVLVEARLGTQRSDEEDIPE